jgi:hypothetical protein
MQTESLHYKSFLFHKKVYFANRCSSDARSDGKTKKDLSKAGIAEVTYSY